MQRITITLHIDIPDTAKVPMPDVDYSAEPEHVQPLPPQALYDPSEMVRPAAQGAPACPQHGAMTRFPPGVNKAGKPYNASWRCSTNGCTTKAIWDKDAA